VHSFKDTEGRPWVLSISVFQAKRVKALLGVDLLSLFDNKCEGLIALVTDMVTLVDVLYVLCMEEANKRNVSDEDFGKAMGGDVLQFAVEAFTDELIDFFPDPKRRSAIRKIMTTSRKLQDKMMEEMETEVEKINVDSLLSEWKKQSGNSPDSSGSIQDHSLSANST